MASHLPEFTVSVNGVRIGAYHTNTGDSSGFVVVSTKEARQGALGLQDPDQYSRIGFSDERGSAVAIASAAGDTGPMNEFEREIAQQFIKALEDRLTRLGHKNKPASVDYPTAFDKERATSLFVNKTIRENALKGIMKEVAKSIKKAPSISTVLEQNFPDEQYEKSRGDAAVGVSEILQQYSRQGATEKTVSDKTLGIVSILQKNFPGDEHARARVKAMKSLLGLTVDQSGKSVDQRSARG